MLEYYLGSLAFGGVLILASLVFGSADTDADVDADADMDIDAEMELDVEGDMVQVDAPADVVASR